MKLPLSLKGSVEDFSCPDRGLQSIQEFDYPNVWALLAWIGIFVAAEQAVHAVMLGFKVRDLKYRTRVSPFQFPTFLGLLWVFFTSLSIMLVGLTWRSNAAILAKSLHVVSEALFFVQLCYEFGFVFLSAFSFTTVMIILTMTLTLPCVTTVGVASISGIVLDSTNFLAYAFYGLSEPNNAKLWTAIAAFGAHALYLLSFIIVQNADISNVLLAGFRILGMVFNIIASEIFLRLVQKIHYPDFQGVYTKTQDWLIGHSDKVVLVWDSFSPNIVGFEGKQEVQIYPFDPYTTAYTRPSLIMLGALMPMIGKVKVSHEDKALLRLQWSIFFAFCFQTTVAKRNSLPGNIYVLDWNYLRIPYQVFAVLLGILMTFV